MTHPALIKNNVKVYGTGPKTLVLAHGYGCDQSMWRFIWPAFVEKYQIILYDLTGCGNSDLSAYDFDAYQKLEAHAADLISILHTLDIAQCTVIGHSVSSMISMLAAIEQPALFEQLVMICPSPRYINDDQYEGGFSESDIMGLLDAQDSNYLGWSSDIAPMIIGDPHQLDLQVELANRFCRNNPDIARHFAKATFLSDYRIDLPKLQTPTLIIDCAFDRLAPLSVGTFMEQSIPHTTRTTLQLQGHCPHLSAPNATVRAIQHFLLASEKKSK
ncbi:MAG: alpha/beta hydrolase [Saprospiraceae bacterium]|nr:alpha/beta hydrolase [Saprospiraceae bacterium]